MDNYSEKFAQFIYMCEDAEKRRIGAVLVSHPSVIGDTYDEVIESLSRLADAGLGLQVARREPV